MTKKNKPSLHAPRNPFILHVMKRIGAAGVHGKTKKAIRAQDKRNLKKDYLYKAA